MRTEGTRRIIQDPRRDAAAVVLLLGLIAFFAIPILEGRVCDMPTVPGVPLLMIGPILLAAPIVIRSSRGTAIASAIALFVVLFVIDLGIYFLAGLDHCGLQLGAGTCVLS